MKKIFYLTLVLFIAGSVQTPVNAIEMINASGPGSSASNYAFFRLNKIDRLVYLAFYGGAHKLGDDLVVEITHVSSGALVHTEYLTAHGGGTVEYFSIDGLEPGQYQIEVTGNIYNLSQIFVLD